MSEPSIKDVKVTNLTDLNPDVFKKVDRVSQFDGLRGIFALSVFWYHLWASDTPAIRDFGGASILNGLALSPLQAFLAGWQFVLAFFVLSGFALMAPVLTRGKSFSWLAYYASRLVRLYLPAAGSILLAVVLVFYIARPTIGPGFEWVRAATLQVLLPENLRDAFLLDDGSGLALNSPLWSLRWEILFSLILPLLVAILLLIFRRLSFAATFFMLLGLAAGMMLLQNKPIFYFTVFMVGMTIASDFGAFKELAVRAADRMGRKSFTTVGLTGAIVLFWFSGSHDINFDVGIFQITPVMQMLAALVATVLLMFTGMTGGFKAFLESAVVQFLGKISFSLYLTHVPVLTALIYLIPREQWYLHMLIAIPVCLAAATVFWLLVERPSHKLSQHIKRSVERRQVASSERG